MPMHMFLSTSVVAAIYVTSFKPKQKTLPGVMTLYYVITSSPSGRHQTLAKKAVTQSILISSLGGVGIVSKEAMRAVESPLLRVFGKVSGRGFGEEIGKEQGRNAFSIERCWRLLIRRLSSIIASAKAWFVSGGRNCWTTFPPFRGIMSDEMKWRSFDVQPEVVSSLTAAPGPLRQRLNLNFISRVGVVLLKGWRERRGRTAEKTRIHRGVARGEIMEGTVGNKERDRKVKIEKKNK